MRYFVTGATGFIGGRLVRHLLAAGHQVVALVRNPDKAEHLSALGVELAEGDITDVDTLFQPMAGADGLFHLAAIYELGADPELLARVNVEGTRNVLEVMKTVGVRKGVYTSTLAVNSDTGGELVDESYRHTGPHLSAYDETKWRAHHEVAEAFIVQGLPLVIVMPGIVYGPGDTSQFGELLQKAIQGDHVPVPDAPTGGCWAHVDDIAHGHVLAMDQGRVGESYIIAGPCHTFRKGFETAAEAAGADLNAVFVPPGMLRKSARVMNVVEKVVPVPATFSAEALRASGGTTYYGDNAKAVAELGYAPRSLEQGMRDTFGPDAPTP